MTGKERLQKALAHQEGPVSVDFGAATISGMHCSIVEKLRNYYGLEKRSVKIHEPYQMLGYIDSDLAQAVGVDIKGIFARNTAFGFPVEDWKEWKTPWGQDVLVPGGFNVTQEGGEVYIYPQGDMTVAPSGKMPEGGYFFDSTNRQKPIVENDLKAEDNLEEVELFTDDDLAYFKREIEEAKKTGLGIIVNFGGMAFGDIAEVPGPGLKDPKGIRDVTEWYVSTLTRSKLIHEIFEKRAEAALENLKRAYAVVGNGPDAVYICGTDFGTQNSLFCSIDTYENLYAPYYRILNDWIHENTEWKTFKHSCGAVEPFMQHFIDSGFDIINPVQCSAAGMEPQLLKDRYGEKLVFWGGGIDTQQTLPFGTPAQVKAEAESRLRIFSSGGGYIFNSIHNIQAGTPVENVAALIESVHSFNRSRE